MKTKLLKSSTIVILCAFPILILCFNDLLSQQRTSGELLFGAQGISANLEWKVKWSATLSFRWFSDYKLTSQYSSGESTTFTGPGYDNYGLHSPSSTGEENIAWGRYQFTYYFYYPGGTVTKYFNLDLIDGNWTGYSPYAPDPDTYIRWNDNSGIKKFQYSINGTAGPWYNFPNASSKQIWKMWDKNSSPNTDVFQPTTPWNLRCINPTRFGHNPEFAWNSPFYPENTTFTYDIYRDAGGGYNKINDDPITGTTYTDTGVEIDIFGTTTYYYVKAQGSDSPDSDPSNVINIKTDHAEKKQSGDELTHHEGNGNKIDLLNVFPNPFNPSTTIFYEISNDGHVQIGIYNIAGQRIIELVNEFKHSGNYTIN